MSRDRGLPAAGYLQGLPVIECRRAPRLAKNPGRENSGSAAGSADLSSTALDGVRAGQVMRDRTLSIPKRPRNVRDSPGGRGDSSHPRPLEHVVRDGRWVERHERPPVMPGRRMMKIRDGGCNLESVAPGIVREPLAALRPEWRPNHATSRQRSLLLRPDGRG